jgi:hypothetical protein
MAKIPNPFNLIKAFQKPKKEPEIYVEYDAPDKPRKKLKKGQFDFEEHLLHELGFSVESVSDTQTIYYCEVIPHLKIMWDIENSLIYMYAGDNLYGKINFVPNNRIFTDMFVKKTIYNLK